MLHVFFGNAPVLVRQKAFAFVAKHEEKGAKLISIDADSYEPGIVTDAVSSVSLFGEEYLYLLDMPSLKPEYDEELKTTLEAMGESGTIFVVIEGPLLASEKKVFEKYGKVEESKGESAERFNVFALADSLSRKDKKTLWIGLCEAKESGLGAEEIIGTLWWQLKTLRLANFTSSADEAGMKDFPYNKAKRSLKNFKEGEIEDISHKLLSLYHDGHVGKVDIDLALEKWILSI